MGLTDEEKLSKKKKQTLQEVRLSGRLAVQANTYLLGIAVKAAALRELAGVDECFGCAMEEKFQSHKSMNFNVSPWH